MAPAAPWTREVRVILSGGGGGTGGTGEADHSNAGNRKRKNRGLFYGSALARPVTMETEIPLAEKQ